MHKTHTTQKKTRRAWGRKPRCFWVTILVSSIQKKQNTPQRVRAGVGGEGRTTRFCEIIYLFLINMEFSSTITVCSSRRNKRDEVGYEEPNLIRRTPTSHRGRERDPRGVLITPSFLPSFLPSLYTLVRRCVSSRFPYALAR